MATFHIQPSSSTVNWTGKKVLGLHTGSIDIAEGYLELTNGEVKAGEISIDMASLTITDIDDIQTHEEFKAHLYSSDFFAIDQFSTARLVLSHSLAMSGTQYRLSGLLTIKDITHPISFDGTIEELTEYLLARGELIIDRTLYNIRYGSGKFIDNLGDKLIYDQFVLQFKIVGKANWH
ncbi:YceI family protein [Dyadobacter crusticola]|uniref:YceI family protein n=1 Tax=Dyadobacter crusticola TaxID=292407 RepID=UPI0004E0E5B2|nr:YceI family protein [Dyadobacter crusticola]